MEDPEKSQVFTKYPNFLGKSSRGAFRVRHLAHGDQRRRARLRPRPDDGDGHGGASPRIVAAGGALTTVADALPGLGIVAAVLGVVITMGALGGPPEEIGHKVAAALVGTFLGILLCYGFLGPLASNHHQDERRGSRLPALPAAGRDRVRERSGAGAGGGIRPALHSRRAAARPSRKSKPPARAAPRRGAPAEQKVA